MLALIGPRDLVARRRFSSLTDCVFAGRLWSRSLFSKEGKVRGIFSPGATSCFKPCVHCLPSYLNSGWVCHSGGMNDILSTITTAQLFSWQKLTFSHRFLFSNLISCVRAANTCCCQTSIWNIYRYCTWLVCRTTSGHGCCLRVPQMMFQRTESQITVKKYFVHLSPFRNLLDQYAVCLFCKSQWENRPDYSFLFLYLSHNFSTCICYCGLLIYTTF